jgi:hypothetical protein
MQSSKMETIGISGIFKDELPQQFLNVMSKAGWEYIKHIYEKVIDRYSDNKDKHFSKIFIECLKSVKSWCPRTKYEELNKIKRQYPYLSQIYECTYLSALKEFCRSLYHKELKQRRIIIPVFDDFFVLFLTKISDEDYIQNLTILKYTFDQLMFLFSMLLRSAFMDCIQFISIPPLEQQKNSRKEFHHKPYEQDVESIMSLSEDNLKWHERNQGMNENEYIKDKANIAESVRSFKQKLETSKQSHSDDFSDIKSIKSSQSSRTNMTNQSLKSHRSRKSHVVLVSNIDKLSTLPISHNSQIPQQVQSSQSFQTSQILHNPQTLHTNQPPLHTEQPPLHTEQPPLYTQQPSFQTHSPLQNHQPVQDPQSLQNSQILQTSQPLRSQQIIPKSTKTNSISSANIQQPPVKIPELETDN